MYKPLLIIALFTTIACQESGRHKTEDPLKALKHQIHVAIASLYPWEAIAKAIDAEDALPEPQIVSDAEKFQVKFKVRNLNRDELSVKVKNQFIYFEGKRKETNSNIHHFENHITRRYALPPNSNQEEVTAVLKDDVLIISVPKHDLPPPPPEREVPIIKVGLPPKVEDKGKPEEYFKATTTKKERRHKHRPNNSIPLKQ